MPDDFDAVCADQVVAIIAAGSEKLALAKEDVEWGVRMMRTYGNLPPVVDATQHDAYALQARDIIETNIGRRTHDLQRVIARFLRTHDGALAIALLMRAVEWKTEILGGLGSASSQ